MAQEKTVFLFLYHQKNSSHDGHAYDLRVYEIQTTVLGSGVPNPISLITLKLVVGGKTTLGMYRLDLGKKIFIDFPDDEIATKVLRSVSAEVTEKSINLLAWKWKKLLSQ